MQNMVVVSCCHILWLYCIIVFSKSAVVKRVHLPTSSEQFFLFHPLNFCFSIAFYVSRQDPHDDHVNLSEFHDFPWLKSTRFPPVNSKVAVRYMFDTYQLKEAPPRSWVECQGESMSFQRFSRGPFRNIRKKKQHGTHI